MRKNIKRVCNSLTLLNFFSMSSNSFNKSNGKIFMMPLIDNVSIHLWNRLRLNFKSLTKINPTKFS